MQRDGKHHGVRCFVLRAAAYQRRFVLSAAACRERRFILRRAAACRMRRSVSNDASSYVQVQNDASLYMQVSNGASSCVQVTADPDDGTVTFIFTFELFIPMVGLEFSYDHTSGLALLKGFFIFLLCLKMHSEQRKVITYLLRCEKI